MIGEEGTTQIECPECGSDDVEPMGTVGDTYSMDLETLCRCKSCGNVWTVRE